MSRRSETASPPGADPRQARGRARVDEALRLFVGGELDPQSADEATEAKRAQLLGMVTYALSQLPKSDLALVRLIYGLDLTPAAVAAMTPHVSEAECIRRTLAILDQLGFSMGERGQR